MDMHMLSADPAQATAWRRFRSELESRDTGDRAAALAARAKAARRTIIETIAGAGAGHVGGDLSVIDVLTTLFDGVLEVDPLNPHWPGRDRFILSKGHCAAALYTTLANAGFFSPAALDTFMRPLSDLNGHPANTKVPGVETSTGPLGHGLPFGVGSAWALRKAGNGARVFVVLGDGEMQEGSNWEALMAASQFRLTNLVAVIDRNRLQQGARTEETNALDPLPERLRAFGWEVREVDGHDIGELLDVFTVRDRERPLAVVANTTKGKGVSFMEDRVEWHHKVPDPGQVTRALEELR
jgi:transketolase